MPAVWMKEVSVQSWLARRHSGAHVRARRLRLLPLSCSICQVCNTYRSRRWLLGEEDLILVVTMFFKLASIGLSN